MKIITEKKLLVTIVIIMFLTYVCKDEKVVITYIYVARRAGKYMSRNTCNLVAFDFNELLLMLIIHVTYT